MMKELKAVGYVSADALEHDSLSKIIIDENCAESLSGLADHDHIIVIASYMDEIKKQIWGDGPLIWLAKVKLISIAGNAVTVQGLTEMREANAPVFGIKPYCPEYDLQDGDKEPEWAKFILNEYIRCS